VGGGEPSLKISAPWLLWFGSEGVLKIFSEIIMKHQEGLGYTRQSRETILGWKGRLFRESRLGRGTSLAHCCAVLEAGAHRFLRLHQPAVDDLT
jgi:hypothetical protein